MEHIVLAKHKEIVAISVDQKLYQAYKKLGYRYIDKRVGDDAKAVVMNWQKRQRNIDLMKLFGGLSLLFLTYWVYFYALLT